MIAPVRSASAPRRVGRGPRGGLLVEAVLSLLLVAAGAFLWFLWRRGAVTAALSRPAPPAASPAAPGADVRETSAWIQSRVRDVLAGGGVTDGHVLKSYNRQRDEKGTAWLEDTMEIRAPAAFDARDFRARLATPLQKKDLRVMTDERKGGAWRLEIGDGRRVYQRLIFLEGPAAARAR